MKPSRQKKQIRKLKRRVTDLEYTIGHEQRRIDHLEEVITSLTNSDPEGYA